MTKTNKQTQDAFKEFNVSMSNAQDSLKKGLGELVRSSAVDAESKLKQKEAIELKKIEIKLENSDIEKFS